MTAFYCGSHLPREHGSLTHNCSKCAMPGCSYTTTCSCNAPPLCLDCSLRRTPIHQHNSAQHTMIKSSADANSLKSPFPVTCSSLCVIPTTKEDRLHYTSGIVARHSRKRGQNQMDGFSLFPSQILVLSTMNGKTIDLDAFDSFNSEDGSYSTRCVCGAVNTLRPESIHAPIVKMKCSGCYMHYEVRVSS